MIARRIYDWGREQPHKTALIHNDHKISYAVFARAIEGFRRYFSRHDLPPGKTAVLVVPNLANCWAYAIALRSLGLTTLCVQALDDVRNLAVADVACLVVDHVSLVHQMGTIAALRGAKLLVVPVGAAGNVNEGAIPEPPVGAPPFGGQMPYTSGTTGTYKTLLMSGALDDERNEVLAKTWSCDRNAIIHCLNFPIWTAAGILFPSIAWHVGGTVIVDQRPYGLERFFKHHPTRAFLIPTMMNKLLALHTDPSARHDECEIELGGGGISVDRAERSRRFITRETRILYGATESPLILYSHVETADDVHWLTPMKGRVVEIVTEEGAPCAVGEEGELRVVLRKTDCSAYVGDPETSARFFRDGYFYPGDMAVRREDGRIRILGRAADVLNVQGFKIPVAPLEEKVQAALGVNAVCLFSGLNDAGEDELVVAIENDHPVNQSDLDRVARQFSQFERVRFEMIARFPRTEAGMAKIKRAELKKLLSAKR